MVHSLIYSAFWMVDETLKFVSAQLFFFKHLFTYAFQWEPFVVLFLQKQPCFTMLYNRVGLNIAWQPIARQYFVYSVTMMTYYKMEFACQSIMLSIFFF